MSKIKEINFLKIIFSITKDGNIIVDANADKLILKNQDKCASLINEFGQKIIQLIIEENKNIEKE